MEKYYVPSIEEIYAGFIIEARMIQEPTGRWNFCNNGEYREWIVTPSNVYILSTIVSENDYIRVKYLDQEDLESLGFVCVGINSDGFEFQNIVDDYLFYDIYFDPEDDFSLQIEKFYQPNMVVAKKGIYNSTTIFNGIIKNKSELKKLLEQLNIK